MFGYVTVNKPEIKFKDFDMYRSFYCGLCRELRERYGIPGQISLTYDMTFVVLLLSGLYEPPTQKGTSRCAVHPLKPQPVRRNEITTYCADMNVILSYYKCMDDWQDERKPLRYAYARLLNAGGKKRMAGYPEKIRKIQDALLKLSRLENRARQMWTGWQDVPDRLWKRFLRSVRMCGKLRCGGWDFISGSSFISWMPMMTWKKTRKTEITIHFLRNIRWKGSKKRYAGCL